MTTQLHDTGEEFVIDTLFRQDTITRPGGLDVGLYNDSTDSLSDTDDIGDISTEPSGGAYGRQTATLDGGDFTQSDNASNNWQVVITDQTFDTSNSSQSVDAYFVIVSFQADDTGDGSTTDHLFFTGDLDQTYDLGSVDTFTLSGAGLEVD